MVKVLHGVARQFIEEKPAFHELVKIYNQVSELQNEVASLAEDGDTVQRATDLLSAAESFLNEVKELVLTID
jgi:uncharacterized protein (UPF0332 family)